MAFVEMWQQYKSSIGTGTNYVQVLPRRLHLDPSFVAKRFSKRTNTLFKEVQVIPARAATTKQMRAAFKQKPRRGESRAKLLAQLRVRLREIVLENWSETYDHAILHSSGLDSRMLSWTIRQLYEERGADWLGNVLFLCSKREAQAFNAIMQYEGWAKNQYWVPRENVRMQEYYAPSLLDFKGAWERANGCAAIPVNLFWYPIWLAQEKELIGDPVQLWTGQWGNTVFDAGSGALAGAGIQQDYERFYGSILCSRPKKGIEVVQFYTDCELASITATSKIRLGTRLRPLLLASMDARLATFTNMRSDGDRHVRIADKIIAKMVRDYRGSWYGKKIAPQAKPNWKTTEFQPFWSRWTAASLCEHLRNNEYSIHV